MVTVIVDEIKNNVIVNNDPIIVSVDSRNITTTIEESNTNVSIEENNTTVTVGNVSSVIYYNTGGAGITYTAMFGDSSPVLLYTLSSIDCLNTIDVFVEQPFDGVNASISIGTPVDHTRFFDITDTDLTLANTYFSKEFSDVGPFGVMLYITPGFGCSTGKLRLQISVLPKG